MPYLWTTNHHPHSEFEAAAADDPTVETIRRVATLNGGALYQMGWADPENGILQWIQSRETTVLQSEGHADDWLLKLRVEAREMLDDLQDYCDDHDIDFEVVRLYELTDPKMGQYNITDKQRELLIVALEMGYFEIPRDATLGAVADSIGISPKAASERLRRGQTNLVSNTLTIGQSTGVGL